MNKGCKKIIVVASYDELVKQAKHSKKKETIVLENYEFLFELNLNDFLKDVGICKKSDDESVLTLSRRLVLENVKIKSIVIENLRSEDVSNNIQINHSYINSLGIYTCYFHSLIIEESSIADLNIIDTYILNDMYFDFSEVAPEIPVKINFVDTTFGGNVSINNLTLSKKDSELNLCGEKNTIKGDFLLCDSILINGYINFSSDFEQSCIFKKINSRLDEYGKEIAINYGAIAFNGGEIKKDLVFVYCHVDSISVANTPIGGSREFNFSYNQLKCEAASILREGALKRNDLVLTEKYTAEVLNARLKDNAIATYNKWANILESKEKKIKFNKRKSFFKKIWEAIILLIPSITTSEGLVLWLNKYSNNYNRSWLRGVVFTLMATFLSYIILNRFGMEQPYFVFDIYFNGFDEVIKGFLSLLDVFNLTGIADIVSFNLTTCGYVILFLAKVLITYGFWQTIYAFFRYRK